MKNKVIVCIVIVLLFIGLLSLSGCSSKVTQINTYEVFRIERVEKVKGTTQVVLSLTSETTGLKYSVLENYKGQKKGDRLSLSFSKN